MSRLSDGMIDAIAKVAPIGCKAPEWSDGTITGRRFVVVGANSPFEAPAMSRPNEMNGFHGHVHWSDIRKHIECSRLASEVKPIAIKIFSHLAEAEAKVHGVATEDVSFHEVGQADSIVDIVGAAFLISATQATWSVGPLPLGGGTVETAHGRLPVPAPATAALLEGFPVTDDGVSGERVTPTGAAILRALDCVSRSGLQGRLLRSGVGFGERKLAGLPNILRATVFSRQSAAKDCQGHRELGVIPFEVDDQTPEDMAIALERLRAMSGIHDVIQLSAFGKKGRMTTHVQVLADPAHLESAIAACFHETTTIGLRVGRVEGRALRREVKAVPVQDRSVRLKTVRRPDGIRTAKVEADDLLSADGQAARTWLRQMAENELRGHE